MNQFNIPFINKSILSELQEKIDRKTKPLGSLGKLEKIARQIGCIQNTLAPRLTKPTVVIFAGDHGIAKTGVSPFPQEVTFQMVYNFLQGGAGINVFARQNGMEIKVVDAGVNHVFGAHPLLIDAKIAMGTKNYLIEPAMSDSECIEAIRRGASIVETIQGQGCNVIGFGEMGISNTSSASIIMSLLCDLPLEQCIGRGTGHTDGGMQKKKALLKEAVNQHIGIEKTPFNILKTFGGFETAMMCGAMLQSAASGMVILVDGFIATSALLVAATFNPAVKEYGIYCHQSGEQGHRLMLNYLEADPILNLEMRLGEGTGAAVAYPLICAAVNFLNEMASFESAGVSNKVV